jgi:hypothetical protein
MNNQEEQKSVILYPAYSFVCPDCEQSNYADPIKPDLTTEQITELKWKMGMPDEVIEQLRTHPSEVRCNSCEKTFGVVKNDEESDDPEILTLGDISDDFGYTTDYDEEQNGGLIL